MKQGDDAPFSLSTFSKSPNLTTVALQQIVEQIVTGLGYDLVEIERTGGGLLRITIDLPWTAAPALEQFITVEDCEKVTRQLQFALEVDAIEYQRLEVSSPGIDRPLRNTQDFVRFAGQMVDITLRVPLGAAAAGQVHASRKKFRGTLERVEGTDHRWQIVWSNAPPPKPGQRIGKKRAPEPLQVLGFTFDELREARLAPMVDFRGRRSAADFGAGVNLADMGGAVVGRAPDGQDDLQETENRRVVE